MNKVGRLCTDRLFFSSPVETASTCRLPTCATRTSHWVVTPPHSRARLVDLVLQGNSLHFCEEIFSSEKCKEFPVVLRAARSPSCMALATPRRVVPSPRVPGRGRPVLWRNFSLQLCEQIGSNFPQWCTAHFLGEFTDICAMSRFLLLDICAITC